ncbi:MAG: IMP dehydrogenase [Thermoguttaceae bacterium]|nr:IMP dehydrogenase [Thermoguttaceae bacterium]
MLNPQDLQEVAVTFDDVLLEPQYSEVVPKLVSVQTRLTRRIALNIPLISAPMDSVTESKMAIALAQAGGVGVIHKNLTIEKQAEEVAQVKRSANGVIRNPATVTTSADVEEIRNVMDVHHVSGVPVVDENYRLVGIVTKRDLRFVDNSKTPVADVMTTKNLVKASGEVGLEEAAQILMRSKVEKLLLVDDDNRLTGLITIRDVDMTHNFPDACKDATGRLRVGASVGVLEKEHDRATALIEAGADFLVVDSAHGHSKNVIEMAKWIKSTYGDKIDVVAGNIATYEGCRALIDAGADAVKVGIGPGSICTTRVVSGVGIPQMTAISRAVKAAEGTDVGIIADGGVRFSGDVVKALAAGAHCVMLGSLFAGLEEAPGEQILYQGRFYKKYRGMGSKGAMVQGSSDRYFQEGQKADKLVPEGVEGRVPYRGKLSAQVDQLVGGVRAGMGYCGAATIEELRQKAKFVRVSPATVRENHPHDIIITEEAPNYSTRSFE